MQTIKGIRVAPQTGGCSSCLFVHSHDHCALGRRQGCMQIRKHYELDHATPMTIKERVEEMIRLMELPLIGPANVAMSQRLSALAAMLHQPRKDGYRKPDGTLITKEEYSFLSRAEQLTCVSSQLCTLGRDEVLQVFETVSGAEHIVDYQKFATALQEALTSKIEAAADDDLGLT